MKSKKNGKKGSKRTLVLYFVVIVLSAVVIFLHFKIVSTQKSDSVKINLAGRQRMLTQKLSKEILQYHSNGYLTQDKEKIKRTVKVFDRTLSALLSGGDAPLDLKSQKFVHLPQLEDILIISQLKKVVKLWKLFKVCALGFIGKKVTKDLNFVIRYNEELLIEMNKVVFMMQSSAEDRNYNINWILYLTYFGAIVALVILLVRNLYKMKYTKVYIKHLETILPICANCKKIREPNAEPANQGSWTEIEGYIEKRSESMFSHSICPSCEEELYGKEDWYKQSKHDHDDS